MSIVQGFCADLALLVQVGVYVQSRTTLDRTEVQEPMLEMEIALVGEHELTLPPASFRWDQFDRRDKVWERTQDLKRVRAEHHLHRELWRSSSAEM